MFAGEKKRLQLVFDNSLIGVAIDRLKGNSCFKRVRDTVSDIRRNQCQQAVLWLACGDWKGCFNRGTKRRTREVSEVS